MLRDYTKNINNQVNSKTKLRAINLYSNGYTQQPVIITSPASCKYILILVADTFAVNGPVTIPVPPASSNIL